MRTYWGWFLDPGIEFPTPSTATNAGPLLINAAGSLEYRPEAQIELDNFFLASDSVRTYTNSSCMEAANEAARRAVNRLAAVAGSAARPVCYGHWRSRSFEVVSGGGSDPVRVGV